MRYMLICHARLGDILQCMPAARHLQQQGHEVWINCHPRYHDIFACFDYVKPAYMPVAHFDRTLMMGIAPESGGNPSRYLKYRRSKKRWQEWVFSGYPELRDCVPRAPEFTRISWCNRSDYNVPRERPVTMIAAAGYSQVVKYSRAEVERKAIELQAGVRMPIYSLADQQLKQPYSLCARKLRHLPDLISWADNFVAINSAPAIIRCALGLPYVHFPQTGDFEQDDTYYLLNP